MSDTLRAWLSEELERRKWSQGELARQSGISRPYISQVLSGDASPSVNFVAKVAAALNEPLDKLMRLAGILPSSEDDPTLAEIQDILKNLSPRQRKEALRFLRYLYQNGQEGK